MLCLDLLLPLTIPTEVDVSRVRQETSWMDNNNNTRLFKPALPKAHAATLLGKVVCDSLGSTE
jgi:hypothetical protein